MVCASGFLLSVLISAAISVSSGAPNNTFSFDNGKFRVSFAIEGDDIVFDMEAEIQGWIGEEIYETIKMKDFP
jgi:hypothetical protein